MVKVMVADRFINNLNRKLHGLLSTGDDLMFKEIVNSLEASGPDYAKNVIDRLSACNGYIVDEICKKCPELIERLYGK